MKFDLNNEFDKLCQLIDKHNIISFDIYDTALLRNVLYPADLFDLVQLELEKQNINLSFKKLRSESEYKARKQTTREDITIHDIYRNVSNKIGKQLSDQIKEMELYLEKKFTVKNTFIYKVYKYAVSRNKLVIFVSDMYLEKTFISDLLKENGYLHYHDLFVSGEIGLSKATSNLYMYIKNQMEICGSWLHIGDNWISDYENPGKCGIDAYYYPPLRERVSIPNNYSIYQSIMKAIQINYCETSMDLNYWNRFGIYHVSPLFFGFTHWLVMQLKGKNNVYFLSRDGYLPYQLFKKFSSIVEGLPEPQYLYASRKTYQLPNILNMAQEEALELLTFTNSKLGQKLYLRDIFENLGLDPEAYHERIKGFGFQNYDEPIQTKEQQKNAKSLLKSIYRDILSQLGEKKSLLEQYLWQNGIYNFNEINIVDVGWRGSTQKAIQDISGIKTTGYYFGTSYNVYKDIKENVYGYAFNLGKPIEIMQKVMDNVMMYEFIFSAPHGKLIGFHKESDQIVPRLDQGSEFIHEIIDEIQTGILSITDQYLNYYDYLDKASKEDCLTDYINFIDSKKYEDLVQFSKLTAQVGFGESEQLNYVSRVSIEDYLKNRKRIKKDIKKNLWKNALIVEGSAEEFKRKPLFRWKLTLFSMITKENTVKAIKNPKKALSYLKRLTNNK